MLGAEQRFAWRMIAPTFLVTGAVLVVPLVLSFYISMTHWDITVVPTRVAWVGLDNYISLIGSEQTHSVLRFTFVYTLTSVAGAFVLALGLALLLNRVRAGRGIFTSLLILPMMMTPIVTGLVWRLLYNPEYGAINDIFGLGSLLWLGNPRYAGAAVIIATIWQNTGFIMILILAALRTMPHEPSEAAMVDGASVWQRFRYITIPFLMPTLMVALLIRTLFEFRAFDLIWILTGGGPGGATETISLMNYRIGFRHFALGPGAALSWIMLAITAIINAGYIYLIYRSRRLQR